MLKYQGEWERAITDITLAGRPHLLREAANQWDAVFEWLEELAALVFELSSKSASWKGKGADAFRTHLADLRAAIKLTASSHKLTAVGLRAAAQYLEDAMKAIPLPGWCADEIREMQRKSFAEGVRVQIPRFEFEKSLMAWAQQLSAMTGEPLTEQHRQELQKMLDDGDTKARKAYEKLGGDYGRLVGGMPGGTPIAVPTVNVGDAKTGGKGSTGKTAAGKTSASANRGITPQQLAQQQTAAQNPLQNLLQNALNPGTTPTSPSTSLPDIKTPDIKTPDIKTPDLDPLDPFKPGGSLAGLDSDFKGAGGGGGGIGSVGGGGGGKLPIGEATAMPAIAMGSTKAAAASVRGGGGANGNNRAANRMTGGMMPMMGGMGAGMGNQQDAAARNTCLREDDDLFAPDDCTPAGVLDT